MTKHEECMKYLASAIDEALELIYDNQMGFALLVFPFDSHSADYISNAKRENMIKALRETADRFERNEIIGVSQGTA